MIKYCKYCQNAFSPARNDAKFCSPKHRSLFHNKKSTFQKKIIKALTKNYNILKQKLDFASEKFDIDVTEELYESFEKIKSLGFNENVYTYKISLNSNLIFDIRYSIDNEINIISFHYILEELKSRM